MAKNEKPLVLVADDEPSTLALVANHLRSRGYRVIEAADGDEAWNAACRELPDIVVLDVMMPGMSGWEVCRKIREAVSLAHTGVVMLTGIGDTLNELTSPLYGADAYLDKPFQFAKLAELVESTLESRSGGKLGRPKKTSGPGTRLYKTSLDDEEEPRSERRPTKAKKEAKASQAAKKVEKAAADMKKKAKKLVKKVQKAAEKVVAQAKKAAGVTASKPTKKVAKSAPKKSAKKAKSAAKVPVAAQKKAPKKSAKKAAPPSPKKKAPLKKTAAPKKKAAPAKSAKKEAARKK
jgi:DNA-binding response OmpR family regulator